MRAAKRDANEAELIALWRKLGALVIEMDRHAGFDLLVIHRGEVYIVEVKDGSKRWKLTPREREQCRKIEAVGVPYSIITSANDALELIGAK